MEREDLERSLGYRFKTSALLTQALTHSSSNREGWNNERMEFLGDSVLDLYVGSELVRLMPHGTPGDMAQVRAKCVCEAALHERAAEIGLLSHVITGRNCAVTRRILADCMEAVIGAAYLDGGLGAVKMIDLQVGIVRLT